MDQKFTTTELELGQDAEKLSGQQQIILLMICMGLTDKMIARAIFRSPETVKSHLKILFILFGVESRAALVREALCHGVVRPALSIAFALLILPGAFADNSMRSARGSASSLRSRTEYHITQGAI